MDGLLLNVSRRGGAALHLFFFKSVGLRCLCENAGVAVASLILVMGMPVHQTFAKNSTVKLSLSDSTLINRLNYGYLAYNVRKVCLVDGYFYHGIHLRLPILKNFTDQLTRLKIYDRTRCRAECQRFRPVYLSMIEMKEVFHDSISAWYLKVVGLIADLRIRPAIATGRVKKALVAAVGEASRFLWGSATIGDIQDLKDMLQKVQMSAEVSALDSARTRDVMGTFSTLQNERLTLLKEMVTTEHDSLLTLLGKVMDDDTALLSMEKVSIAVMNAMAHFTQLHDGLQQLDFGIEELLYGRLSPKLVPVTEMRRILTSVDQLLHPDRQLCTLSIADAYSSLKFDYLREGREILIRLHLPFSRTDLKLRFDTLSLDMPVSKGLKSQLPELPSRIIVDEDSQTIGVLSQVTESFYVDRNQVDFSKTPKQRCLWALIYGEEAQVIENCVFSVVRDDPVAMYKWVATNTYVFNGLSRLSMHCGNFTQHLPTCNPCLITLPCGCFIKSGLNLLVENMEFCGNESIPHSESVLYAVNLAIIQNFYDDMEGTSPAQLFTFPQKLPQMNFTFFTDKFAHLAARDQKIAYDMTKLSSSLQNSSVVLATPLEAMIYGFLNAGSHFWETNLNTWTTYAFILLFAGALINFTLIWRLRRQLSFLMLASMVTRAKAFALRSTAASVMVQSDWREIFQNILSELRHIDFVVIAISVLTALSLICIFFKLRALGRRSSNVFLQFCFSKTTEEVLLYHLPLSTRDYSFALPSKISVRFRYLFFFGIIQANADKWHVSHTLTEKRLKLPTILVVGPCMARKLRGFSTETKVNVAVIHNFEYEFLTDMNLAIQVPRKSCETQV